MNHNIIFLSGLFPKERRDEIFRESKGVIQYAADNLQWSIVKGLEKNKANLTLVNLPYIGSFPQRYKKIYSKSYLFSHNSVSKDYNVGFINLPIYKSFSRFLNAKRILNKLLRNNKEKTTILIYAMHTPFIKAGIDAKKTNPNAKIILIVPDLPEFMGGESSIMINLFKKIDTKFLYKNMNKIDGFVLLSEYMKEPLRIEDKPYTIIEGIFDNSLQLTSLEKEKKFTILYTGTLAKRYGVLNLLDSFVRLDNPDFRLWICGDGDGKEEILTAAKLDSRIIYWGQLPYDKILKLQKKASVLVNPRAPESDFTKYSFPSKTMEYLASGTPTILYKLQGIPEEYYQYCFVINGNEENGLKNKILEVYNLPQSEKDVISNRAKSFIFDKKNPKIQTLKIIELINKLH